MPEHADELTTTQVAALVNSTRRAVNNAIRDGRLQARCEQTPRGPVYWIARADAEAYRDSVQQWHDTRPSVRTRRQSD
jgi:hypothetical protein